MKKFIYKMVDAYDRSPELGVLAASIAFFLTGIGALFVSILISDEAAASYFMVSVGLSVLGVLATIVGVFLPKYVHYLSEGTVDWGVYPMSLLGRECTIAGYTSTLTVLVLTAYSVLGVVVATLVVLPFTALLALAGICVTLVGLHYGLKMVFKVRNAFNRHVKDPNAHQNAGDTQETQVDKAA